MKKKSLDWFDFIVSDCVHFCTTVIFPSFFYEGNVLMVEKLVTKSVGSVKMTGTY